MCVHHFKAVRISISLGFMIGASEFLKFSIDYLMS